MQEEIEERTVAISLTATRLSARALGVCFKEFLSLGKKEVGNLKNQKTKGKQSVSSLMAKSRKIKSTDLSREEYKEFQKIAAKYQISYAIRKDGIKKDTYTLFFKGKDKKAIQAFFKEYSERVLSPEKAKETLGEKIERLNRKMPQKAMVPEKRRELSR